MDRSQLQHILQRAQARLAADRDGELARSGMPSPLAFLCLAPLEVLAALDDPGEASDLLLELVGKEHRRPLLAALRGPRDALAVLADGSPLAEACAALVGALDGQALIQVVDGVRQEIRGTTLSHIRQVVANTYIEAADEARAQAERALLGSLRTLRHQCNTVQLARIDPRESRHHAELRLERVYIGLNTERQVAPGADDLPQRAEREHRPRGERDTRPLTALEALAQPPAARLLLLGVPGSGKSTFVNHLALCLAGACLGQRDPAEASQGAALLERLAPHWTLGALLPIRVVLRELAAFPPLLQAQVGTLAVLHAFLQHALAPHGQAMDLLVEALGVGRAVLLFDGLDEVEAGPVLVRVTECISAAAGVYTRSRVLVTCRVLDYQANAQRRLPGFQVETLAALDDQQIDAFIGAWHDEVAATGRSLLGTAAGLRQALAGRADLREMARQPLLLTMMAIVHAGKGTLPEARALLYGECIELLLLRWRAEPDAPDLLLQLGLPEFKEPDLIKLMARIGFAAHNRSLGEAGAAERPVDLSGAEVKAELEAAFTHHVADEERRAALAVRLLRACATRNGLLLKQSGERGEVYAFPHRSFQEFLAGYWLSLQSDFDRLAWERAGKVGWHEALRLMVSYQAQKEVPLGPTLQVIKDLLEAGDALRRTLAGELLALVGYPRAADYRAEWAGAQGRWARACATLRMVSTADSEVAAAPLRARAGMALGQLCYSSSAALASQGAVPPVPDPRLLDPASGDAPDGRYWCAIESGPFWYGDDRKSNLKQLWLTYGFSIARHPVTNAEFARFIAAGGYEREAWWTPEGWKQKQQGDWQQPRYWTDPDLNNPLQPVVGVSWYEAAAYCRWLTALGQEAGWLQHEEEIRLPTSLEWERAARHTDTRRYPWGDDEPSAERANYTETAIEYTAPIGCFPSGAAVCGAEDMAGNVYEWMCSTDEQPDNAQKDFTPDAAVLISWSCYSDASEYLCCGARFDDDPFGRVNNQGFRVLRSRALTE